MPLLVIRVPLTSGCRGGAGEKEPEDLGLGRPSRGYLEPKLLHLLPVRRLHPLPNPTPRVRSQDSGAWLERVARFERAQREHAGPGQDLDAGGNLAREGLVLRPETLRHAGRLVQPDRQLPHLLLQRPQGRLHTRLHQPPQRLGPVTRWPLHTAELGGCAGDWLNRLSLPVCSRLASARRRSDIKRFVQKMAAAITRVHRVTKQASPSPRLG